MRKLFYSFLIIFRFCTVTFAQDVTSTVKGVVTDQATGSPLQGVNIKIENESAAFSGTTDDLGKFSIETGVERYKVTVSYTGYGTSVQEILTIAGKDLTLNISLRETVQQLQEIEVESSTLPTEMAGQRSLTIEKTLRIPANYLDPVRSVTAYPGVVVANDQGNSIIVRGNSPNGLLWKVNGVDIVNPNHLSNAGTFADKPMANGGGVNIISAQMLDRTDFYMGQLPTSYGNALAGIIDMNLREGNKEKLEVTAQASLIGLDVAAEGPLGKNENTSFLANYRYSTVGLLSKLGVDFGDEAIAFQDASFHLNHRSSKGILFSLFGFWGGSTNDFDAKAEEEWEVEKDQYDINYKSNTGALGANISIPLAMGKLAAAVAYSTTSQNRNAEISPEAYGSGIFVKTDNYEQSNAILSTRLSFSTALAKKVDWEVGANLNLLDNTVDAFKVQVFGVTPIEQQLFGGNDGALFQPYTNFHFKLTPTLSMNAGARYVTYSFNSTSALEPRADLTFSPNTNSLFNLSYALVSQTQLPQFYAVNRDLELTKSHRFDASYKRTLANDVELRTGIYYQHLFDVPISPGVPISAINFLEGLPPSELVSAGTGKNYGVDLTVEKQFFNKHYILVGGSYYESKYMTFDNIERDSRFSGKYTFSAIHGKEWTKISKRRTIGLNSRLLYLGGMRENSVSETFSVLAGETVYNFNDPYNQKLADYFRVDVRLSFRKNKPGYTRTFAIDIQNLTNQQNQAYQYYDRVQGETLWKYHLGIIPVLVYRVDF